MPDEKVLDILKKAILLEKQGCSFYRGVADQARDDAVKNIFTIMAEEEQKHENLLAEQASRIKKGEGFDRNYSLGDQDEFSREVLSPKIVKQISVSGYEAAAISAAIAMEGKAVDLYSRRGEESTDEAEKAMYKELSVWEKTHLTFLSEIYQDLLESSWNDSNFWPF